MTPDDALAHLAALRSADPPTHGGRVLSYVYDPARADLDELAARAATAFLPVNGLDPTTFVSVGVLEKDLVAFARGLVHGEGAVGSVTSGGTESCLLAVKSARDRFAAAHPGERPTLVLPTTAHPAFRKAAHYLGLDRVEVPVAPATGAVEADRMLAAVAAQPTALAVLSAPNYPLGVLDPIDAIAPALADLGVPVHVDACVGGFLLPFWPVPLPAWDFRVPGVTSISLDAHKYGYAPKGASLVLYRDREAHAAQYFASTEWPGYPVVNPTALGSRSATAMAAAWAITRVLGVEGYRDLVATIAAAAARVRATLDRIDGLRVAGAPVGPLLAATADGPDGVDPFLFVDAARRRGFVLQAQPAFTQPDGTVLPRSVHLSVTPATAEVADELCAALVAAADEVRGLPAPTPDPSLVQQVAAEGLPRDQAVVLATLEALPREVAPAALTGLLAAVIDPDAQV